MRLSGSFDSRRLWHERLTTGFFTIDDTTYMHPGIGQATSGHNILITKQTNEILRWIYRLQEQLKRYYFELCSELCLNSESAKFKLRCYETFELIEEANYCRILKYPKVFDLEKYPV